MIKKLKNENALREYYFKTVQTTEYHHHIPFKPRWINYLYANLNGYFWFSCYKCGQKYGGHETYGSVNNRLVCPTCALKNYNETGLLDN